MLFSDLISDWARAYMYLQHIWEESPQSGNGSLERNETGEPCLDESGNSDPHTPHTCINPTMINLAFHPSINPTMIGDI